MKRIVLIYSLILITFSNFCQNNDSIIYFTDYSNYFSLSAYGIQKSGNLSFSDKNSSDKLLYTPNSTLNIGLHGQYKWIGLGIAANLLPNKNEDKYGKSSSLNLGLTLTPKQWLLSFFLSFNQGMYLKNTEDVIKNWDHKNYHYMDSLTVLNFNVSVLRVLNKKFSYKAAYNFNQTQNKSAGSTLLGGFISSYALATDESLIPTEVRSNFVTADSIRTIGIMSFGISGGYTYTFVIKKHFFLNLYLVSHLGTQAIGISGVDGVDLNPDSKLHLTTGYQLKLSIGYNTNKWIAGMRFSTNAYSVQGLSDAEAAYDSNVFRIYVGRRFGTSK